MIDYDDANIYENIRAKVVETEEEFIFSTLGNYIYNQTETVVSKKELIEAVQLLRMCKEYGYNISERWTTATQQSMELGCEYRRGFQDGVNKEHDRIINILEDEKK